MLMPLYCGSQIGLRLCWAFIGAKGISVNTRNVLKGQMYQNISYKFFCGIFEDTGKARGCSVNTVVNDSLIK